MYRCIAIHDVPIRVSIQQKEYRFIDLSIYCCVLINELFAAMDKTEIDVLQKIVVR